MQAESVYTCSNNEQGRIYHNYDLMRPGVGFLGQSMILIVISKSAFYDLYSGADSQANYMYVFSKYYRVASTKISNY